MAAEDAAPSAHQDKANAATGDIHLARQTGSVPASIPVRTPANGANASTGRRMIGVQPCNAASAVVIAKPIAAPSMQPNAPTITAYSQTNSAM
jgi:hypothetical protein